MTISIAHPERYDRHDWMAKMEAPVPEREEEWELIGYVDQLYPGGETGAFLWGHLKPEYQRTEGDTDAD